MYFNEEQHSQLFETLIDFKLAPVIRRNHRIRQILEVLETPQKYELVALVKDDMSSS